MTSETTGDLVDAINPVNGPALDDCVLKLPAGNEHFSSEFQPFQTTRRPYHIQRYRLSFIRLRHEYHSVYGVLNG